MEVTATPTLPVSRRGQCRESELSRLSSDVPVLLCIALPDRHTLVRSEGSAMKPFYLTKAIMLHDGSSGHDTAKQATLHA